MKIQVERINETNTGNLIAYVDVCIGGCVVIKGCKILTSNGGRFVGLPSQKGKDGKFYDHVYFKSKELKQQFNDAVLDQVKAKLKPDVVDQPTTNEGAAWEE